MPLLTRDLGLNKALGLFVELAIAAVRLTFSKKLTHLSWPFPRGFATGKATPEKYTTLLHVWVKYVNDTYPTIGFLQAMRVDTELSSEGEEPEVFECGAPVPAGPIARSRR